MRPWRLRRAGWLALALPSVILPLSGQCAPAPSEPQLGTEIDAIFAADIKSGGPTDTQHARIRGIFAEHGVPTDEMIGERAAEEYVLLLSGEPLTFLETVLPRLERAAAAANKKAAAGKPSTPHP